MTPKTVIHVGLNASSELDTDQGEGFGEQLQFSTQQLEAKFNLET